MQRKILFVDDDPILRKSIQPHLEDQREHFITVVARDGFEALKILQSSPFSLVVCDLMMPRMDGISLIKHLRENYPDIPTIIATGLSVDKVGDLAKSPDILAFLSKPYHPETLSSIILSALRREAEGGIMNDVSPAVFLQFVEIDARTCSIRVLDKNGRHGGMLYFLDGDLIDVRIDELRGIEAALKFFTWSTATLFLRNDCPPRANTINSGLQTIIMKAAGMRDEDESLPEEEGDSEDGPLADEAKVRIQLQPDAESNLVRLLRDQIGHACRPEDIDQGATVMAAVEQLQLLGEAAGLGDFHLGRLHDPHRERLLVLGPPAALVSLPTATAERLLAFLNDHER
jgi:CheY-like chemotaxis protein